MLGSKNRTLEALQVTGCAFIPGPPSRNVTSIISNNQELYCELNGLLYLSMLMATRLNMDEVLDVTSMAM